mmetsp:Transcript_74667/g.198631  ORF Transcript_74667/g.198631 Transcript_74667/m.198631 type:complete len:224 (+) Transcript_74667:33-704(+)
MLHGARRWSSALASCGAATIVGGLKFVSCGGNGHYSELLEGTLQGSCPAAVANRVQVVAISKNESAQRERQWDVWIADLTDAAQAGAVAADRCVTWVANVHVASSSAQVARGFAFGEDETGEEKVYFFYLRSEADDAQQGCMQVRVAGDVVTIDALCSLGNHGGECLLHYLVEWLRTTAPGATRIDVMPLSDGWLRQGYYSRLGFVSKPEGCGSMTRAVEAFG